MNADQFQQLLDIFNKTQSELLKQLAERQTAFHPHPVQQQNAPPLQIIIPPFEQYDATKENFKFYMQRFENYLSMRGVLTDKAVCHQILINSIGPKHFMLMVSLVAPQKISDVEYDVLVRKLETHLCPKKNVFVLQHRFLSTYQGEGQTLSEYVAMLRRDLNECEFVSTCDCKADISNIFLRAQFIRGLKDGHIREQLLQSEEPDFNKILEKAVSLEASRIDSRELESKNSATSDVNKVRSRSSNRNGRQKFQKSSSSAKLVENKGTSNNFA